MANNFSQEVAERLLDKLSSDQKFRKLFQENPRAALRLLGHETPESEIGVRGSDPVMCLTGAAGLASMDDIKAARDRLQAQLSSSVFHYDVTV